MGDDKKTVIFNRVYFNQVILTYKTFEPGMDVTIFESKLKNLLKWN